MNRFEDLLKETAIPRMVPVEFSVRRGSIRREDIPSVIRKTIGERGVLDRFQPGKSVALTCGSREINNIDKIMRSVVDILKEHGMKPFIFAAMGSHGGACAEGQLEILAGYHVTEESMGVPVVATMDTVVIGQTPKGMDVHMEANANQADYILPIGRIKPHTDFRGSIESGLIKMLCIGCGKQHGANLCHTYGFPSMPENITQAARVIMEKKNVPFGLGIIEDAFHGTYQLTAIPGEMIEEEETELLKIAKSLIPTIPFDKVDVLVLDEIGKDISGSGMDPNVTGRSGMLGISRPFIERIAVLGLSEKSHHNGCGIGLADITTQRFFEDMNYYVSYPNGLTSHDPASMRIPPVMPNDRCAVKMALQTCMNHTKDLGYRVVWMKNTLKLDSFYISEALMDEVDKNPAITVKGKPESVAFDEEGNVPWLPAPVYEYGHHEKA